MTDLLEIIKKDLKEYGVNYVLEPSKFLSYSNNIQVKGYFSYEPLELKVAYLNPEWHKILLHEYCHFLQYKEQASIWREVINNNYFQKFDDWLSHKIELSESELNLIIDKIVELEKDCELRVIELINKYNLGIENYDQEMNAYIEYYSKVKKTRVFDSSLIYQQT